MKKTVHEEGAGTLREYNRKRDFTRTAEPGPKVHRPASKRELMFVIQKHDATRLHYDFRIEMDGVLKSWAVPKGLPAKRGDRRLAVHVEDHPMDYARFEGTIPPGNYGAGTVMVWDIGTYKIKDSDPSKALKAGKFHIVLKGKKLRGEWALIRMKPRPGESSDKENWLIFKADEDVEPVSAKADDQSVLTRRSMAMIAGENKAQWQSDRPAAARKDVDIRIAKAVAKRHALQAAVPENKARKRKLKPDLAFVEPMKCRLADEPPVGSKWIYEIKFDGFRALALKSGSKVQLLSRSNKSLNARFPEMVQAVAKLPFENGILDGEIVALDDEGRSSFQLLQMANMPGQKMPPLCFYAFDILNLEGSDLKSLPLRDRKRILHDALGDARSDVRFSANIEGDPRELLSEVRRRGLEGIIAKNLDSPYEVGQRTGCWQKIKVINTQEFVIGGYTQPKGSRDFFGAILVGYYKGDKFIFVSRVGTGFNQGLLKSMHTTFRKLETKECPFSNLPEARTGRWGQGVTRAEMKRCTWVDPQLVCQISFTEWTRDDHLRHPVFLGLREDKKPVDVVKEVAKHSDK